MITQFKVLNYYLINKVKLKRSLELNIKGLICTQNNLMYTIKFKIKIIVNLFKQQNVFIYIYFPMFP